MADSEGNPVTPLAPETPAQETPTQQKQSLDLGSTVQQGDGSSSESVAKAIPIALNLAFLRDPHDNGPSGSGSQRIPSGPNSSWSPGSDMQLGQQSSASDISNDRVFPIRSVVSVDASSGRPAAEDYFPSLAGVEARGIPAHPPSAHAGTELQRSDTAPMSPRSFAPSDRQTRSRRKSTISGRPVGSSPDPRQARSPGPLQLALAPSSDKDTESESGALGDNAAGHGSASVTSGHESIDAPHIMGRFTHVEDGDGHQVITGRDGVLQRCEDEPIHTPGAVQGFGVLVALREENDGRFGVRYASENSGKILGYTPSQLFRLGSFLDILREEQQENLLDHIDFIRDEDADPAVNGPEVFSLSIRPPRRKSTKLWCAIHINPAHPDLVICEFELDDDQKHPLRPIDEVAPKAPTDTLHANSTAEELVGSTEILSKPLRVLRSARKRRGEQGAMQVFDIMSQVQEQLASAPNLEEFLKVLVGIMKELTGFHRVMIYQFDSSFNGKVVTELVDASQTVDLYKGLHFPAADIPRQARDLYKLNKVRLLYDRDLETARLVCRSKEDLDIALDMSHAYLRAMSPIHLKYLANMEVRSSMSVSINAFNELWGLIACHSYGNHGMRVSFPIRKMCRLVGDTASRNIERLSYAARLQARKLIHTAPTDKNPSGYIIASSDDMLRLFDADFGLLSIKGETKIMGKLEQSQEALAMVEYLRMRRLTYVVASQNITEDFPDLRYPPGFQVVAGLLYVPLSVGGHDFIVFFRKGQAKEVKWAGNPYEKKIRPGTAGYLEPRKSFKTWKEMVVGKCREWDEAQVESAAVLCLVYGKASVPPFDVILIPVGKFIEVWRQKEAALESSKLTRLLLANSAHEVRTPLNAIINYLEIALEGSLDQETRENLGKSHSASKSLIYVINDLLDLTKAEEGKDLIKDEVFDLCVCITEATEPFTKDAQRKGIDYEVVQDSGLPRYVHGDSRRVRQAVANITANAIAHTGTGGSIKVDAFVTSVTDRIANVEIVVADSGAGMSSTQLDALFRDLEQVSTVEPEANTDSEAGDKPREARTLGLGLALVARVVRTMNGQVRVKSEPDQGSRFVIQLPFHLPGAESSPGPAPSQGEVLAMQSADSPNPGPASLTAMPEGEITLVDRASTANVVAENRSVRSGDSRRSMDSMGSYGSQKSDADRLLDAILTPLDMQDGKREGYFDKATSSRASWGKSPSVGSLSVGHGSGSVPSQKLTLPSLTRSREDRPGQAQVRDSKMPVRAVKVPDELQDMPKGAQAGHRAANLTEVNDARAPAQTSTSASKASTSATGEANRLRVLVAEDDPINMKMLRKRLERQGHEVHHTVNGEDCATVYREKSPMFDLVLMDMQVSQEVHICGRDTNEVRCRLLMA